MSPLHLVTLSLLVGLALSRAEAAVPAAFFEMHCYDCHDPDTQKGNLDLASLKPDFANPDIFAHWVKIHDRLESGEMPPKKKARPPTAELAAVKAWLNESLVTAERTRLAAESRTGLRRLTRGEYENTIRDLFDLPGIALQMFLPADGSAHGFDTNSDALDISHVNMAKYVEAADKALDMAIATRSEAPKPATARLSLANTYGGGIMLYNGEAILLRDKKPDPDFPLMGEVRHICRAHAGMVVDPTSSVGVFRHEDESWFPHFSRFAALYPGHYRVRASFWSFQWDKGKILPSRGTEAARLSVVESSESGNQPASYTLGYYDAPSMESRVHELKVWLNPKEGLGFNTASLAHITLYNRKERTLGFTGPCIVNDWVEIEGPIHAVWPPRSHQLLFGDLPLAEFKPAEGKDVRPPVRKPLKQVIRTGDNQPEPETGLWTVETTQPLAAADHLLAAFLPKAFRRPVEEAVRQEYVALVEARLKAGDHFESALRWAYRAALCSPDFLYHIEPAGRLDDFALASRLSYFFWNSMPDDALIALASSGKLRDATVLNAQIERLMKDAKSQRFIEDFLGQWLKLRDIAANDPDKKLYPEFSLTCRTPWSPRRAPTSASSSSRTSMPATS